MTAQNLNPLYGPRRPRRAPLICPDPAGLAVVLEAVAQLSPIEWGILKLNKGLGAEPRHTRKQISERTRLSLEAIDQIIASARAQLASHEPFRRQVLKEGISINGLLARTLRDADTSGFWQEQKR